MGDLIEKNNGSLVFIEAAGILARVKTLNILRQLEGSRNKHVIRFLYEAKQLSTEEGNFPIDLAGSDLIDIDFTHPMLDISFEHVSLPDIYMKNCSFHKVEFYDADFNGARMDYMNFSSSDVEVADFQGGEIMDSTFENAALTAMLTLLLLICKKQILPRRQ